MMLPGTLPKTGVALLLVLLCTACGITAVGTMDERAGTTAAAGAPPEGESSAEGEGPRRVGTGGTSQGGSSIDNGAGSTVAGSGAGIAAEPEGNTPAVNLRLSGAFVLLSKGGISTVPTASILGDLGVSPAAATYITGFALTADATNVFSRSAQVTGKVFAADYALPTPSKLTTAIGDMELAFSAAAARAPDFIEHGTGLIGGMTLAPGVYKWSTAVVISNSVTLAGGPNDVWIFQIAQTLTMSDATKVILQGGALAKNVFWQVSSFVELGTTAHIEGNILGQTSVTLGTGASIRGRLLAQTTIDLGAGVVVRP